jgi:hypothetical protein
MAGFAPLLLPFAVELVPAVGPVMHTDAAAVAVAADYAVPAVAVL